MWVFLLRISSSPPLFRCSRFRQMPFRDFGIWFLRRPAFQLAYFLLSLLVISCIFVQQCEYVAAEGFCFPPPGRSSFLRRCAIALPHEDIDRMFCFFFFFLVGLRQSRFDRCPSPAFTLSYLEQPPWDPSFLSLELFTFQLQEIPSCRSQLFLSWFPCVIGLFAV